MLYSPIEMNRQFESAFKSMGYKELRDAYTISIPNYELEIPGAYKQIDFARNKVLVEVQFGKHAGEGRRSPVPGRGFPARAGRGGHRMDISPCDRQRGDETLHGRPWGESHGTRHGIPAWVWGPEREI